MLTLAELKERLSDFLTEIDLLEVLNISSEDLVERFEDRIEAKYNSLCKDFEEEFDND